jgi:hypothetical protein
MAVVGTLRNVIIEGVPYRAAGDVDVSHILTKYEVSMIPTSGSAEKSMVARIPAAESMVLITTAQEAEQLKNYSEAIDFLNMSFELADGSSYATQGTIEFENRETATGRTTIQMLPRDDWTLFAA